MVASRRVPDHLELQLNRPLAATALARRTLLRTGEADPRGAPHRLAAAHRLPAERELSRALAARLSPQRARSLAGETKSLRSLVTLFTQADLMVTSDCGPGHMAALTDLPCFDLWSRTPQLYAPLSPHNHSLGRFGVQPLLDCVQPSQVQLPSQRLHGRDQRRAGVPGVAGSLRRAARLARPATGLEMRPPILAAHSSRAIFGQRQVDQFAGLRLHPRVLAWCRGGIARLNRQSPQWRDDIDRQPEPRLADPQLPAVIGQRLRRGAYSSASNPRRTSHLGKFVRPQQAADHRCSASQ